MNVLEEIKSEIHKFIKETSRKYILWGAGPSGRRCYEWLYIHGLSHNILSYVDCDPRKQNTELFDIPIVSGEAAKELYPNSTIIISTMQHRKVFETVCKHQFANPVFVFDDWTVGFYKNGSYDIDKNKLYHIYRSDSHTRLAIDLCLWMRKNNFGGVIPYKYMALTPQYADYWDTEESSLSVFDGITLVDGGAFTGDTIESMYNRYGNRLLEIHAFEPDTSNLKIMEKTIARLDLEDITYKHPYGMDSSNKILNFSSDGKTSRFDSGGDFQVKVKRLDSVQITPKGKLCIKMDIEGFEMEALKGAAETIRKYKPELAICVYHKYDDILDIPTLIKSIVPEYNCLLRCCHHIECYASIERF